ncbi:MAG TPA: hypothetical protein VGR52_07025, partial [Stellaceae bacterium]|nr:hypothetical protein [Stellaceae bacterium]
RRRRRSDDQATAEARRVVARHVPADQRRLRQLDHRHDPRHHHLAEGGGALAYQYLMVPLALWATSWSGYAFPRPPALDDTLWQLMFGMLGMGGLRTYEKLKGVAGNH